jgi:hypothetical protein
VGHFAVPSRSSGEARPGRHKVDKKFILLINTCRLTALPAIFKITHYQGLAFSLNKLSFALVVFIKE